MPPLTHRRKSQLAVEYAHRVREQSLKTWVLWIHANNAVRFDQSLCDVADQLKIDGRKDPKTDLLPLLQNWLRNEGKGRWLLILDNADDASFLLEPPATSNNGPLMRRRIDYIPACDHGSMIITTRSKREAQKLTYNSDIVEVPAMSEGEAEALLEIKLGQSSPELRLLAVALDCMPLAIAQAAAYVRERGSRSSPQLYREMIEESRGTRTKLLRHQLPLPNRDGEAINSVLLTWQISFDHIRNMRRSAADLLSLMSFCDRLAIPEILLCTSFDRRQLSDDRSDFEDDIAMLRSFSFVSDTADAQSWGMHRLVQDATQDWLNGRKDYSEALIRFVHRLFALFPTGDFQNWEICRTLFPHAKNIAEQEPVDQSALLEWSLVMYRSAWYAVEQGNFSDALAMATSSMKVRVKQLGERDESTLWSIAMVALIY